MTNNAKSSNSMYLTDSGYGYAQDARYHNHNTASMEEDDNNTITMNAMRQGSIVDSRSPTSYSASAYNNIQQQQQQRHDSGQYQDDQLRRDLQLGQSQQEQSQRQQQQQQQYHHQNAQQQQYLDQNSQQQYYEQDSQPQSQKQQYHDQNSQQQQLQPELELQQQQQQQYVGQSPLQQSQSQPQQQTAKNPSVVVKVGMVGDAQIGKTSLMVKYVEGSWDEDYIQTLGVNFMEKTISIRNTDITFSIWDLGGQREFVNMLPLVCNDAVAILFMFDLTRKSTLNSIKEWYRQGRGFNKTAIPFLVGTKYDHFVNFPQEDQLEISTQARRFAKAMKASLIFSSTSHSINVQKIFKIVLSKAFDLKCTIPEIENPGEPLLIYQSVG